MMKIPYSDALNMVTSVEPVYAVRKYPVERAVGKILAEPVYAKYSVPISPVSAMDGFAVSSKKTVEASENNPVTLRDFDRVNTGNVVRGCYDAVIMIEDVEFDGSEDPAEITIRAPISSGRNVRATGEDIEAGRLVLPAGSRIRAFDIGALAGYGITEVSVYSVSVGIIPTGSELIAPGDIPLPGEVVESNSVMTEAYLKEFGVDVICYPPVSDNQALIRGAISRAVKENEIVLISAGSSMGSRDFTAKAIADLGEVLFHGVLMKPAKPSMLGIVEGKPIIGMPGFPLAVQTAERLFVRTLLEGWGLKGPEQETLLAEAGEDVKSDRDIDEFRFASAAKVDGRVVVLPQIRSASMQMNGIRANGYMHIPRGLGKVKAGEAVTTVLNVPVEELSSTVLFAGVYSAGVERVAASAAASGLSVRFGDVSSENPNLLRNKACHALCVTESFDVDALEDIPLEAYPLGDNTILLMRCDMQDDICNRLRVFAGGIR